MNRSFQDLIKIYFESLNYYRSTSIELNRLLRKSSRERVGRGGSLAYLPTLPRVSPM